MKALTDDVTDRPTLGVALLDSPVDIITIEEAFDLTNENGGWTFSTGYIERNKALNDHRNNDHHTGHQNRHHQTTFIHHPEIIPWQRVTLRVTIHEVAGTSKDKFVHDHTYDQSHRNQNGCKQPVEGTAGRCLFRFDIWIAHKIG